jgi:hypothetical protein
MGEIIEADKSFFKKQAQQKKIPSSLKISSLLDELEEEMKPDNKNYEKKIHQQIIDLIKSNFNLKVQKTSKSILFDQEGPKKIIFIPNKKIVLHLIFNKTRQPTNIKDKFDHYYLDLTDFPKIQSIENDVLDYVK